MRQTRFLKFALILSGAVVLLVGLLIQLDPENFYASYQLELPFNINWHNELRATSGYLITSGLLVMAGAFAKLLRMASVIISLNLYGSFVLGRLLSIAIDGVPAGALISALVIELLMGLLVLTAVIHNTKRKKVGMDQQAAMRTD